MSGRLGGTSGIKCSYGFCSLIYIHSPPASRSHASNSPNSSLRAQCMRVRLSRHLPTCLISDLYSVFISLCLSLSLFSLFPSSLSLSPSFSHSLSVCIEPCRPRPRRASPRWSSSLVLPPPPPGNSCWLLGMIWVREPCQPASHRDNYLLLRRVQQRKKS